MKVYHGLKTFLWQAPKIMDKENSALNMWLFIIISMIIDRTAEFTKPTIVNCYLPCTSKLPETP